MSKFAKEDRARLKPDGNIIMTIVTVNARRITGLYCCRWERGKKVEKGFFQEDQLILVDDKFVEENRTTFELNEKDIAYWMLGKLEETGELYQDETADLIAEKFGGEYTYINENKNPAIASLVLKEFRKLHKGQIDWIKAKKLWRKKKTSE